ncbi:hypothetical protein GCM10023093_19580 [Nemorincola caseinilytica]|uniref:TonB C-terminal domain-containing protein n=1 Tax=Nemorincola caseinilytica TaxID=2054315 RepID=A0ABP8NIP8_9BACT
MMTRNIAALLLAMCAMHTAYAQLPANAMATIPTADNTIYDTVDVVAKPQFEMNRFLANSINYPDVARENDIQGRVIVRFVVNVDSTITDIEIMRSPHELLSAEVLRVVHNMPVWEPAKLNGRPVRSRFYLPVVFKLEGGRKKKHSKQKDTGEEGVWE